jgi:hypothetical protein
MKRLYSEKSFALTEKNASFQLILRENAMAKDGMMWRVRSLLP